MAISGGATVTITSAAADEEAGGGLPDQAQANGIDEIVFSDAISTLGNGNLVASPVYEGRLVIIRQGAIDEETRYIISSTTGTGNTYICTVHEAWDDPPAQSDSAYVSYIPIDANTIGNDFKLLSKRQSDWVAADEIAIGNGTDFAFFALVDGHSIETVDNSSTTVADVTVLNNGRLDTGYVSNGTPVSGGYLVGTPAIVGEFVLDVDSGGTANLNDFFLTCVVLNKTVLQGTVNCRKAKFFKASYAMDLTGDVTLSQNSSIEGTSTTDETLLCDASTDIQSCALISTNGFTSAGVSETITLTNVTFVGNTRLVEVYDDTTWNFINPAWTPATGTQDDLSFLETGTGKVNELFSFDSNVTTAAGVAISGATTYIYEGLNSGNLPYSGVTDSLGDYSTNLLTSVYTEATATTVDKESFGDYAYRVYKYGKSPFIGQLAVDTAVEQPVALSDDGDITAASQSTALSNGDGITISRHSTGETDIRPLKALHFASGSNILSDGEVIKGVASSAQATVIEFVGDSTEGTVVVSGWNGTEFQNGETLDNTPSAGSWTAVADVAGESASFYEEYTWLVDANGEDLTVVYDYLAAQMASGSLGSEYVDALIWGGSEQSQLLYNSANGYVTYRNTANAEGVWVANYGAGTIAFLTADNGATYVPPVQYTFSLTGLKTASEVRVYNATTDVEIDGVETSSTSYSYNYIYGGDIDIYVHILHLDYQWLKLTGLSLSNSNQAIPVQQIVDRNYENLS